MLLLFSGRAATYYCTLKKTTLFIFNLVSFGAIMLTLGILGEYIWRTFDASRNRPPYVIEEESEWERDEKL